MWREEGLGGPHVAAVEVEHSGDGAVPDTWDELSVATSHAMIAGRQVVRMETGEAVVEPPVPPCPLSPLRGPPGRRLLWRPLGCVT